MPPNPSLEGTTAGRSPQPLGVTMASSEVGPVLVKGQFDEDCSNLCDESQ